MIALFKETLESSIWERCIRMVLGLLYYHWKQVLSVLEHKTKILVCLSKYVVYICDTVVMSSHCPRYTGSCQTPTGPGYQGVHE